MATETGRTDPSADDIRTLGQWRRVARGLLTKDDLESASFESDHIARHVLGLNAADLVLQSDRVLLPEERDRLSQLLQRRREGIPFQYVLGTVEFAGITLKICPGVFIPRPETEGLVEHVLEYLENPARHAVSMDSPTAVVDLCTGSGAIALALAAGQPGLHVQGTDLSEDAIGLARENARHLGMSDTVQFLAGDLGAPLERAGSRVSVVVSNPPYISPHDRERVDPGVLQHEPHRALFAREDGLAIIRRIVSEAAELLHDGGLLAMEIAEDAGERVRTILSEDARWDDIRIKDDLAKKNRYVLAVRAKSPRSG